MKGHFVPWLYAIAAKIRQVSLREMALDASVMAAAVIDSGKLFNSPVLCMNFDPTLWGEAAGCSTNWEGALPLIEPGGSPDPNPDAVRESVRVTTLVEAIGRVKGAMPQSKLVCAVAGPATIARLLEFENPVSRMDQFTVGELVTEFVTVLCENKIDNVILVEDAQIDDHALAPWVEGKQYSRIARLADHYSAETTLLCPQASLDEDQTREFDAFTYVVGQPEKTIQAKLTNAAKGLVVSGFGTGSVSLPAGLETLEEGGYFLTTAEDLDAEADFSEIQLDIATVTAFLNQPKS
jgi:hypothetical protein